MDLISTIINAVLMLIIISEIININIKLKRQNEQIKDLLFIIDKQKEKINELENIEKQRKPNEHQ